MAKLLIVDDNPDIVEMLAEILAIAGHQVSIAPNGEEGLRQLNASLPDVVLLDVEMPVLDGPGMLYQMLVRDCGQEKVPIVLLSGVVGLERVAARVGTPYFLTKPFSDGAVLSVTDRALKERQAPVPTL